MNRDIKFRFGSGTKMFYDIPNVMECLKQQMAVWQGADPLKSFSTIAYDHEKEHGAMFMQYTGLKDKNRKDIYEGDIVVIPDDPDPTNGSPNALCVVVYVGTQFCYKDIDDESLTPISALIGLADEDEDAEVIGNICENPELLTP